MADTNQTTEEPEPAALWCCICNTRHPFGTPCDQVALDAFRRQSMLVRHLASQQRRPK